MASRKLTKSFDEAVTHLVTEGILFVVKDHPQADFGDIYIVNLKLFISNGGLGINLKFFELYLKDLESALAGLPQFGREWLSMKPSANSSFQIAARHHILGI